MRATFFALFLDSVVVEGIVRIHKPMRDVLSEAIGAKCSQQHHVLLGLAQHAVCSWRSLRSTVIRFLTKIQCITRAVVLTFELSNKKFLEKVWVDIGWFVGQLAAIQFRRVAAANAITWEIRHVTSRFIATYVISDTSTSFSPISSHLPARCTSKLNCITFRNHFDCSSIANSISHFDITLPWITWTPRCALQHVINW